MAERKKYTEAEKLAAVAKVKELGITKASKELGIAVGSLNKWRTELAEIEAENAKKIKAAGKKAKKAITVAKQAIEKTVECCKGVNIHIQSPMGGEITPAEIAAKVPADATDVYVRVDQNAIYWVSGNETGSVAIWE